MPADSYLLRNDSDKEVCKFTDVTKAIAPELQALGLVTSALWTDVDNDGWVDLLMAGEFMPITFFKNQEGKRLKRIAAPSLANSVGWWNSLTSGDFDNDGDMDYIAGNLGLNTRYKANVQEPLCLYVKDFDKNGSIDPVMTYYLQGSKVILHSRDELISQISAMKLRFNNYKDYAEATFEESFLKTELEGAYVLCAEQFQSVYLENKGNGNFSISPLPLQAQFAPMYGSIVDDFNNDGFLDVAMVGNSYATEISTGRYDASVGVYLQGDGHGKFKSVPARESGFYVNEDAKGMVEVTAANGNTLLVIGCNSSPAKVYSMKKQPGMKVLRDETHAFIRRKDGSTRKQEFYYGSTYLSQSSRHLAVPEDAISVEVSGNGKARKIQINLKSKE
jgi:hypothetical protein